MEEKAPQETPTRHLKDLEVEPVAETALKVLLGALVQAALGERLVAKVVPVVQAGPRVADLGLTNRLNRVKL